MYGLDDLGRLIAAERGYLQSVDPVSLTARAFEQEWGLDGTGNWAEFNEDLDGTGWDLEQTRQHNAANEVTGATDWAAPAHDRAGNMVTLPKPADPADALGATYDAWNRLVDVSEGGVLIARFSYDAAGRRILKQLADTQEPDRYIHFYHSGQQVVETRAGDDSAGVPDPAQLDPAYQFVWSPRYIDALILRDQYDGQGQLDAGARLFYLADANFNVTGIVGLVETEPDVFEWQVVERYVYSPYGDVTIYTPDWSATRAESARNNTTLYTGREFDPATGLYYYRARYYHAQLGQFISRDPIGYEAGDVNLYRYVGNRPVDATDPSGLFTTHGPAPAWKVAELERIEQLALERVESWVQFLDGPDFDLIAVRERLAQLGVPGNKLVVRTNMVVNFQLRLKRYAESIKTTIEDSSYQIRFPEADNRNRDFATRVTYRWPRSIWSEDHMCFYPRFFEQDTHYKVGIFTHEISHVAVNTKDDYRWEGPRKTDPVKGELLADNADIAQLWEELGRFTQGVYTPERIFWNWVGTWLRAQRAWQRAQREPSEQP